MSYRDRKKTIDLQQIDNVELYEMMTVCGCI